MSTYFVLNYFAFYQTFAGTNGSNPSSSTGIPNSDNLPS